MTILDDAWVITLNEPIKKNQQDTTMDFVWRRVLELTKADIYRASYEGIDIISSRKGFCPQREWHLRMSKLIDIIKKNQQETTMEEKDKREGAYFWFELGEEQRFGRGQEVKSWRFIIHNREPVYDLKLAQEKLPHQASGKVILAKFVKSGEVKFV